MPYDFEFRSFVKPRWIGKKLNEVFSTEFRYSQLCVDDMITTGTIKIFDKTVSPDYILKDNMLITNVVHRHELPVPSVSIQVLHDDDQLVIVNKPSGVPVLSYEYPRFTPVVVSAITLWSLFSLESTTILIYTVFTD